MSDMKISDAQLHSLMLMLTDIYRLISRKSSGTGNSRHLALGRNGRGLGEKLFKMFHAEAGP